MRKLLGNYCFSVLFVISYAHAAWLFFVQWLHICHRSAMSPVGPELTSLKTACTPFIVCVVLKDTFVARCSFSCSVRSIELQRSCVMPPRCWHFTARATNSLVSVSSSRLYDVDLKGLQTWCSCCVCVVKHKDWFNIPIARLFNSWIQLNPAAEFLVLWLPIPRPRSVSGFTKKLPMKHCY